MPVVLLHGSGRKGPGSVHLCVQVNRKFRLFSFFKHKKMCTLAYYSFNFWIGLRHFKIKKKNLRGKSKSPRRQRMWKTAFKVCMGSEKLGWGGYVLSSQGRRGGMSRS